MFVILALAAGLRLARLDRLPPGLYWDEAYDGADALRVLAGEYPVYFPGNNGREPMFMYLVAGSLAVFGRSPAAIRSVSAAAGTFGVLGVYLAMRAMFGGRVGLIAAALCAVTLWPVQLSRLAIRPSLLQPFLAFALWQGTLAWKTGRRRNWIAAGAILGLAFYTYLPVRLTPLALAIFAAYLLLRRPRRFPPGAGSGAAIGLLSAVIVVAPLALYALTHWEIVMLRASQLSLLNPEVNGGDFWGALLEQAKAVALTFFFRGDENPRHNVPLRPIFDPLTSAAFVIGAFSAARRRRRGPAAALCAIWSAVMLIPAVFAPENPHYLRISGALPVIFAWPALGLDAVAEFLARRLRPRIGWPILVGVVALSAASTIRAYFFGAYSASRELYFAFDAHATDLALEINRFLEIGWQGRGIAARDITPRPGRVVIVEARLWGFHRAIPFLAPLAPAPEGPIVLARPDEAAALPPLDLTSTEVKMIFVPGAEAVMRDYLPQGMLLSAQDGLYIPTPDGSAEYLLYRTYTATTYDGSGRPVGCLGGEIALLDVQVRPAADAVQVELIWRAESPAARDYTAFVHLLDAEGGIAAQHDAPPVNGLLPTSWWRPGDAIRDVHTLLLAAGGQPSAGALPADSRRLAIGLYRPDTGERLAASDCQGAALGDQLIVPR